MSAPQPVQDAINAAYAAYDQLASDLATQTAKVEALSTAQAEKDAADQAVTAAQAASRDAVSKAREALNALLPS